MIVFEALVNNRPCLFSDHFLISAQLVVAIRVRVIYKDKRRGLGKALWQSDTDSWHH